MKKSNIIVSSVAALLIAAFGIPYLFAGSTSNSVAEQADQSALVSENGTDHGAASSLFSFKGHVADHIKACKAKGDTPECEHTKEGCTKEKAKTCDASKKAECCKAKMEECKASGKECTPEMMAKCPHAGSKECTPEMMAKCPHAGSKECKAAKAECKSSGAKKECPHKKSEAAKTEATVTEAK